MDKLSVLIIDDDPDIRHLLNEVLRDTGLDVYDCVDGQDTIETMKTIMPDFVLLDLMMPNMDGYEYLEHVRTEGIEIPIIVLTGMIEADVEERVYALGANGFQRKPIFPTKLINEINRVMGTDFQIKKMA